MEIFVNQALIVLEQNQERNNHNWNKRLNTFINHALQDDEYQEILKIPIEVSNKVSSLKKFLQNFKVINAAGGVVLNGNQLLYIIRNGYFDLPKGKLEKGETFTMAAVREVEEECNLSGIVVSEPQFFATYHVYLHKNKTILKRTKWYLMTIENKKLTPNPQYEEGITETGWINKSEVKSLKIPIYKSIETVINHFVR